MSQEQRQHPPTQPPTGGGDPTGSDLEAGRRENDDLLATALEHIDATISQDSHQELQRARQRSGQ